MERETILVVDDSQEMCRLLRDKLLVPAGYHVMTAFNGNAAIRVVKLHNPHLILLDINLPDMSGIDVLQALLDEKYSIPVIMITSHVEPELILKSFRLGAKDYLQKPFMADDVFAAIDKILAEARWQREREEMTRALNKANQKLQQQVEMWESLDKVGRAITATLNEKDAQYRLMQGINQLMQVEAGSLFLVDEDSGELVLHVSLHGDIEKRAEVRLTPGQGIAGWVLQQGESILVPEAYKDKRFFRGIDKQHTGFLTRSILAVPLIVHKKTVGVIQVLNPIGEKEHFEPVDLKTLETLASSVAVAAENARLYNLMRQSISIETLKKTVVTLSHNINNALMILSMVAGFLKDKSESIPGELRPGWIRQSADTLQGETNRIAQVLKVLERVTTIQETNYHGSMGMIDIEAALKQALSESAASEIDMTG